MTSLEKVRRGMRLKLNETYPIYGEDKCDQVIGYTAPGDVVIIGYSNKDGNEGEGYHETMIVSGSYSGVNTLTLNNMDILRSTPLGDKTCRSTGKQDKNGVEIWEHDILRYETNDGFLCEAVVKFGEYNQDGSGGEYPPTKCLGVFVEIISHEDLYKEDDDYFPDYKRQQSLLEVLDDCEVIGHYQFPLLTLQVEENFSC